MHITLASCWTFGDLDPADGLPRLRELGAEGIEIWTRDLRRWGLDHWQAGLEANGLACAQLCPYLDVVHGPATIDMGHWVLDAMLHACERLGCRRIRVFTGPPWGRWAVGPAAADQATWDEAAAALAAYCDQVGPEIELCLECHPGSLMENAAWARRLIGRVGRPNLTVNLQLPFPGEEPLVSAALLADRCTHIHIHAYEQGWSGANTWLAEGCTDWAGVLRALAGGGARELCLSLEHPDHRRGRDPWQVVARDLPWLQRLRETWADPSCLR
jgi:sugar phosphate isomerase/epimerase